MQKWQNTIPYEHFYSKSLSIKNTLHSESSAVVEIWRMLARTHIINVPLKSTTILLSGSTCQSFHPPNSSCLILESADCLSSSGSSSCMLQQMNLEKALHTFLKNKNNSEAEEPRSETSTWGLEAGTHGHPPMCLKWFHRLSEWSFRMNETTRQTRILCGA